MKNPIESKSVNPGASLLVQWLRICLTMQVTCVPFLGRGLRSHMPCAPKKEPDLSRVVTGMAMRAPQVQLG